MRSPQASQRRTGAPKRVPKRVPEQAPPAALADRLGFLLKHAYENYQSIQRRAIAPLELDGRRLAVLILVDAEGPALQQRLAERLGVDRTTMVSLVDELEASELLRRRRDPDDRRGYQVGVTPKGAQVLAKATEAIRGVEREFLGSLSAPEQRQLRTLLRAVALDRGR